MKERVLFINNSFQGLLHHHHHTSGSLQQTIYCPQRCCSFKNPYLHSFIHSRTQKEGDGEVCKNPATKWMSMTHIFFVDYPLNGTSLNQVTRRADEYRCLRRWNKISHKFCNFIFQPVKTHQPGIQIWELWVLYEFLFFKNTEISSSTKLKGEMYWYCAFMTLPFMCSPDEKIMISLTTYSFSILHVFLFLSEKKLSVPIPQAISTSLTSQPCLMAGSSPTWPRWKTLINMQSWMDLGPNTFLLVESGGSLIDAVVPLHFDFTFYLTSQNSKNWCLCKFYSRIFSTRILFVFNQSIQRGKNKLFSERKNSSPRYKVTNNKCKFFLSQFLYFITIFTSLHTILHFFPPAST